MKIIYSNKGDENPFAKLPQAATAVKGTSDDICGAFSVEKFCAASDLFYTHEDAQGWLNYLGQFHHANFWYQDGNVQPWAYYEDYDNWQDTYGMDAVMAVYHSGHGSMDGSGKFYAALGADWGGLGCNAVSDQMRLGNEQARYIFWSTCLSLRVLDGQNPIRTWQPANLGFRMLFGFETVSIDNPDYGKFFWEEWNQGKSFSTAWLDASWRIYTGQAPSVVACGATQEEAQNRLFNERIFSWEPVSTAWWWWRWYNARAAREPNRALPQSLLTAELQPIEVNEQYVQRVMGQYNFDMKLPSEVSATPTGNFFIKEEDVRLSFGSNGAYEVQLARPDLFNQTQLTSDQAKSIAEETVRRYGLDQEVGLTFDSIRQEYTGGGSDAGSGRTEGPFVTETTMQFRQVINGLPVVTPGAGTVRVSIDNNGTVTKIHAATRSIERLMDRPKNTTASPPMNGSIARPRTMDGPGYEQLLMQEWTKRMASWVVQGRPPLQYTVVPGSTEIGYDIRGNEAILVAQRVVEVDLGSGYRKLYRVVTPILE